jgi:hypothetical protein
VLIRWVGKETGEKVERDLRDTLLPAEREANAPGGRVPLAFGHGKRADQHHKSQFSPRQIVELPLRNPDSSPKECDSSRKNRFSSVKNSDSSLQI